MNDSNKSAWYSIELTLVIIFALDVVATFFLNLLKFGWLKNIIWLKLNVTDAFGLTGWSVYLGSYFGIYLYSV